MTGIAHWHMDERYPFVEDENCNITGDGWQDREEFAHALNEWENETCGEPGLWNADDIAHQWVVMDANDDERVYPCDADTPGAIKVTTLWGAR